MAIEKIINCGETLALVTGNEKIRTDVQSALELAMSVKYSIDTNKIVIHKKVIAEDFFYFRHRTRRRNFAEIYQL